VKPIKILNNLLDTFTDIKSVYHEFDTLEKREFIELVFDSNLYYENGIYRTPMILELLSVNELKMSYLSLSN